MALQRFRKCLFSLIPLVLGILQSSKSQQTDATHSPPLLISSTRVVGEATTKESVIGGGSGLSRSTRIAPNDSTTDKPTPLAVTESTYPQIISARPAYPVNSSIYPELNKPIFRPVFTSIKNGERHVYPYQFSTDILFHFPAFQVQIYAECDEQLSTLELDNNYPLHVAVHWHGTIKSWEIPINYLNHTLAIGKAMMNRYANHSVGKTLWLYPEKSVNKSLRLTLEVSIFSEALVYYKIRIVSLKNFFVPPYKSIIESTTHSSPAFFMFEKPSNESWDYAFIHGMSDSDICTLMIVLPPRGPYVGVENIPKEKKFTETFTRKTGLTVKMKEFPHGFLIIFVPFLDDLKCQKYPKADALLSSDPFRMKLITFEVRKGSSPMKYSFYYPMAIPVGSFVLFAVCAVLAHSIFHKHRIHRNKIKPPDQDSTPRKRFTLDCLSKMTMQELIITEPSRVVGQTNRYCRAGLVTSAFYSVPVFQLISTFSHTLKETGDFDICFFNHFCSHSFWILNDFNHMYSNIWYVLFGCLYMGLVRIRQITYDHNYVESEGEGQGAAKSLFNKLFPKTDGNLKIGVMTHYGLLYCMGYALVMTGVMSAAYHICPNQSNFQFDTVFMYTIAAITVVTIYQARHPTYLSANFTFTALAMVTCITVLGLLWEEFFIRVIFSVVHMLFLILCLPKVCYNGYVRKDGHLVAHWIDMMRILHVKVKDDWENNRTFRIQRVVWRHPGDCNIQIIPGPGRLVLPGFLLLLNCFAIAGTWTIFSTQNFATQVLFICVVNGAVYIVFYSFLKICHGECRDFLWVQPGLYLVSSFALWAYAMFYFLDEVSTWESSPAESRLKNSECIFLEFYDTHDMWHFLSAAALFCSAMVLLTVDDDLLDRSKSTIPVF